MERGGHGAAAWTAALAAVLLWPAAGWGQTVFVEVGAESGIGEYRMPARGFGAGAAAADYDDDGDVDFFAPTASGSADQLYRNLGNGHFEEIAGLVGLGSTALGRDALWLDYNADHRLDLLVGGDCFNSDCDAGLTSLRLFRQEADGTFTDVTAAAGLLDFDHDPGAHRGGAAAGDVNGDGFVDLVASFWMGTLHLYLNQGDGTFADVTLASGLDLAVLGHHQSVIQDFNGDGLFDIFSAVDFTENRLWIHQGTDADGLPFFRDLAPAAGCHNAMNDMGVTLGDFDADGDPDLYVTNIFQDGKHNVLLRNDTAALSPACGETAATAGVDEGGWGWGTSFADLDNDGDLDLAETNGWRFSPWNQPPRLFIHQGDSPPTFVERAAAAGLTNDAWGSSLLAFDYDRDGDLDLLQTVHGSTLELYRNELGSDPATAGRHHLVVRPRMAGRNHWAIGAVVTVEAEGRVHQRFITAGTSYLGQEPAEAFFGLGDASLAERVTVTWPGGRRSVLAGVGVDQVETVRDDVLFSDGFEAGDLAGWSLVRP